MFQPLTKEQYDNAVKAGFSPDEIIANEKQRKAQNAEQPAGYFSRLGQGYIKGAENIISGIEKGAEQVAGGILDIQQGNILSGAGNIVGGLGRSALRTVGQVTQTAFAPIIEAPIVKPTLEAVGTGIAKIPGVDVIIQKANELAQKHPELAKDFQNIVDIATLGIGSSAQKPVGTALEKAGISLEKSGMAAADIAKNTFAQELVSPIETAAVKLQQVKRTTEAGGLFKKDIVTPTTLEIQSAKEVAQIPGISPNNTFQKNFNLVRDFNAKTAQQLESDVAKYDFIIPRKEIISRLNQSAIDLKDNPLIVGDAEKTANKLIEGAKKIVNENQGKGSGLLKARKEYDAWVLSQKPKAFDAKAENAFTTANGAIRDTLNTLLDEKATNLGIKDSLKKQFSLFRAMENIAPKAAQEANTPILRAFEKVGKVLGVKNRLVQAVATAVGIGGLGAAATFAPAVAVLSGTGFVIYQGGKLIMKPEVRIALGKLLQESGSLLKAEDKVILQKALDDYK